MRFRLSTLVPSLLAPGVLATASFALSGVGIPICLGDGSGAACPCGNFGQPGAGCMSSLGIGATLGASNTSGTANVANDIGATDPVLLTVNGLPVGGTCIFFQGSPVSVVLFGDGLRCVGNPFLVKLGIKFGSTGGVANYPASGDPALALQSWMLTPLPAPCSRSYQVWYRNSAAFCTPSLFNFSNAVEVPWS